MITKQLEADLAYTYGKLSSKERGKLSGSTLLITGCAGFLGFYLLHFLYRYKDALSLKQVICLDNFMLGHPAWLREMEEDSRFTVEKFDIITDGIASVPGAGKAGLVIHMASIASPVFYRQYPIETIDANVTGLRRLLDFYCEKPVEGFLFFSSSELYGDPAPEAVPTGEEYYGNVCATGPRACYDEAKRFGETLCMLFSKKYGMPVGVVRPFNNYGPGMKINDKRVPADFAKNVVENQDIQILSSGSPTRTFCYIADAMAGYLKILLHGSYDYFNIGIDRPEISIDRLAGIYQEAGKELFSYSGNITHARSGDKEYLTNNPGRRCPKIDKAARLLGYQPEILVEEGVRRFLTFIKESKENGKDGEGNLLW